MAKSRPIELRGDKELKQLVRDLGQYSDGKTVAKRLRKELKEAGSSAVPAVQSAIRRLPSKGESRKRGRPSLRDNMAKAARLKVSTSKKAPGVTVGVLPSRMPPGQGSLPGYMEGILPRWRHPLFGNWDHPQQQESNPFFFKTIHPMRPDFDAAVVRVAESIVNDLES